MSGVFLTSRNTYIWMPNSLLLLLKDEPESNESINVRQDIAEINSFNYQQGTLRFVHNFGTTDQKV